MFEQDWACLSAKEVQLGIGARDSPMMVARFKRMSFELSVLFDLENPIY